MADLPHQRRELVVEGGIARVELLQPLQRLLRLGMLLARMLGLLGADLLLHLRVDEHLLCHGVPDELDRDLLGELLAPGPRLVRGGAAEGLELPEHLLDLAVILLEDLDHVALLIGHGASWSRLAAAPSLPGRPRADAPMKFGGTGRCR